MEVGVDFNRSERAYDMSLYSTFDQRNDLNTYATHPAHLEVLAYIKEVVETTIVVDYQTSGNVREVRLKYDLKQNNYFYHH